ncbi:hypothetical protein BT96DRAFT_980602 [Gymnopus androsaceus JB14]|uniref:Uncharacterized protein n=1 Tax=Gymnopus androsaceus JB14 TaxID=1447944 RepID=A0A6A4GVA8_9AGAR|nr:hypothetical protein BT96DRAFT_980602 [Gymnopus androsaceus JB14]
MVNYIQNITSLAAAVSNLLNLNGAIGANSNTIMGFPDTRGKDQRTQKSSAFNALPNAPDSQTLGMISDAHHLPSTRSKAHCPSCITEHKDTPIRNSTSIERSIQRLR